MMRSIQNQDGFTLLELILSLVIIAAITAVSLGGIRLGISTREIGEQKVDTFQRLRTIGEQLSQKIQSTYPKFVPPYESIFGSESTKSDALKNRPPPILAFEGTPDSIRFLTYADPMTANGRTSQAHEVRFYLGKHPETGETGIIMMEHDLSDGGTFKITPPHSESVHYFLLAKDVAYLKFRYYQIQQVPPEQLEEGEKESVKYSGQWVDSIRYEPRLIQTRTVNKATVPGTLKKPITLPKGVEISIGLYETPLEGGDEKEEPKLVYSPPMVVPLHSGTKFALNPVDQENDET